MSQTKIQFHGTLVLDKPITPAALTAELTRIQEAYNKDIIGDTYTLNKSDPNTRIQFFSGAPQRSYRVACGANIPELQLAVSCLIDQGYTPHGSMAVDASILFQPMVNAI